MRRNHQKSTKQNQRGISMTEFVIIAPIVMLVLMGMLEIHDRIELKQTTLIMARHTLSHVGVSRHGRDDQKERVSSSPVDGKPGGVTELAAERKAILARVFDDRLYASSIDRADEAPLLTHSAAHRFNLRFKLLDRGGTSWNKKRDDLVASVNSITSDVSDVYVGYARYSATLAREVSKIFDFLKGDLKSLTSFDSLPLFIDDRASTVQSTVELVLPGSSGLWNRSLDLAAQAAARTNVSSLGDVRSFSLGTIFSETETGYHPAYYRAQSILGLAWSFDSELSHWAAKRIPRKLLSSYFTPPVRGFSNGCMFFYSANSGCVVGMTPYNSAIDIGRNVMVVVDVIATVFSAGGYKVAKEAMGVAVDTAIKGAVEEVQTQVKDAVEKEVKSKVAKVKEKVVGEAKQQVESAIRDKIKGPLDKLKPDCFLQRNMTDETAPTPGC